MLSQISTKLSGRKKYAEIIAMPDLGIAHNCTRMIGGFFTGGQYMWDTTVPFIPIDSTVNVCGTNLYKINGEISAQEFVKRVQEVLYDNSKYNWNYNRGNHFISLCKSIGEYETKPGLYMIVHASACEHKNGPNGLYPNSDVWYNSNIQVEYLEGTTRFLRYITGDFAERFYEIARMLIAFNEERNRYFIKRVLGEDSEKEITSIQHYGMPNNHTVCIGCHWENVQYPLLTAPGRPIYLINPENNFEGSPHGLGLELKRPCIQYYNNSIRIGEKKFFSGESVCIGEDAFNRCSSNDTDLDSYVRKILTICPGSVYGKFYQIVSISKDGILYW